MTLDRWSALSGFRLRHVNNSVCVERRLERLSSSALSGSRANNSVFVDRCPDKLFSSALSGSRANNAV